MTDRNKQVYNPELAYKPPKEKNIIMKAGNRSSVGNDSGFIQDLLHLLTMMELNRKHRQKMMGKGTHREQLKGLFGGGE